ncbi:MAG: hypothetical protein HOW73_37945 [Polyangiaceae bacterium]|nr:hypothetical protein [Polyangiaceae bacterium]
MSTRTPVSTSRNRRVVVSTSSAALLVLAVAWAGCSDDTGTGASTSTSNGGGDSGGGGSSFNGGGGSGAEGGGSESGCPIYTTLCDGVCIPTSVDPNNCGDCGVICEGDLACSAGACSDTCLPGQTACDNSCVDVLTNNDHCGGCDMPCPEGEGCANGDCVPAVITADPPRDCGNGGPPIVIGDTPSSCTAMTAFTWAICSCDDAVFSSTLLTDAYDSSAGPYQAPGELGAGVGTNGRFTTSSPADISGALWSSDATGVGLSNDLAVGLELHSGGKYNSSAPGTVGADAFINGDVSTPQTLAITGDLHVPTGADVDDGVTYASLVNEPVDVPPPCACDPAQLLDIAGIVATRATNNDNALIGLDPAVTTNPSEAIRIDLYCGHYYLDEISGSHDVTIVAHGNTALYIGGDVQLSQALNITVDPGYSLDVLIAGHLSVSSGSAFGSPNYPAMTRVYIGGTGGFGMSAGSLFGAFFWAGHGPVTTSGGTEIFGGVFAGDLQASAGVTVHYDLAVQSLDDDCDDPPGGCDSCMDCGNQACVNGECGECTDSSQCCAPLVCVNGQCLPTPE